MDSQKVYIVHLGIINFAQIFKGVYLSFADQFGAGNYPLQNLQNDNCFVTSCKKIIPLLFTSLCIVFP